MTASIATPAEREVRTHATYRPLLRLGTGAMATVELVYRTEGRFHRLFALKRLHPELRRDDQVRAMFVDEAHLAGLIRHPNVASVVDVGEDDEGPFAISEYVEGRTLGELLTELGASGELLPLPAALEIAAQAAAGLHAAHDLRAVDGTFLAVVHRDVSPQNLLVGYDGCVRVADFGIARAWGRLAQTAAGVRKGKTGYMAPEHLRFEELDRRADLFALGVVLVEMLTGRRLYGGDDERAAARRVLAEPPPDVAESRRDVPVALVELLFSLLAKPREARPSTAGIVAQTLRTISLEHVAPVTGAFDLAAYLGDRFGHHRSDKNRTISAQLRVQTGGAR